MEMQEKSRSHETRFGGVRGNRPGRRKGARNRLSEGFIESLYDDFKKHGVDVIRKVREADPVAYLKVAASLVPKHLAVDADPLDELTDDQLRERIALLNKELKGLV